MEWNYGKRTWTGRTGTKLEKVPENRRPSPKSLLKLEREISDAIKDNDVMRHKSIINNL